MEQIAVKILPIFLFILAGFVMRKKAFLSPEMVQGLKKMVLHFGLCPLLFLSFINLRLRRSHLALVICVIVFLLLLYFAGKLVNRIPRLANPAFPFFVPTFTVGMIGIPLLLSVYGPEHLGNISVISAGHELFIWMAYLGFFVTDFRGEKFSLSYLTQVLRSPFLISVAAGLLCNLLGLAEYFYSVSVLMGLRSALEMLAGITAPLILFLLGYELVLERRFVKRALGFVLVRRLLVFSLGFLMLFLVLRHFVPLTPEFRAAWFIFLNLPPIFSLPIFMEYFEGKKEDIALVNNGIVLDNLVCFGVFFVFVLVNSRAFVLG